MDPGFGGQPFQHAVLRKAAVLRSFFPDLYIMMDGGIGPGETASAAAGAGVNVIVSGAHRPWDMTASPSRLCAQTLGCVCEP